MVRKSPVIRRTRRAVKSLAKKVRKMPSRKQGRITGIGALRAIGRKPAKRAIKATKPSSFKKLIRKARSMR